MIARMDSVQSILTKVLHRRGLARHASAARAAFVAERWVRDRLPMFSDAVAVGTCRDGILTVQCSHSVAAQECQQLTPFLLDHLRGECGEGLVSEVRVVRE